MMRGLTKWGLLTVLFFGGVICGATTADRWQALRERNPFIPYGPPKPPAPEPPVPYEFRGRSVENGVEYFSLYNLETKKAFWVSRTGDGDVKVREYDSAQGLVLADRNGRTIRLAFKDPKRPVDGGARRRPGTALAAAPVKSIPAVVAVPPPASESQRLEQVADQIRNRRAQRQQPAGVRS